MEQTFSVSRIERFDKCPLSWRLHYIDHIPEISTPELLIGSAVHKAIEIYCKQLLNGNKRSSINEIISEATDSVSNGEILNDVNRIFQDFIITHDFSKRKVLGVEEDLTHDIGKYKFRGKLDLTEMNNVPLIRDWKTGRRIYSQSEADSSLQASAYALLLYKEYPEFRNSNFFVCKFEFVRFQQVIETIRTQKDIKLTESYLIKKMDTISNAADKNDFPPKPGHFCGWCSYSNRCPIDTKPASPSAIASQILILESILKDAKTRIKALVEKQGPVAINNEIFDFYPQESETYPVAKFMEVLKKNKVLDAFKFLKVDNEEAKRLSPRILEELLPLSIGKVTTKFCHKQREVAQ
ncbi:MAG: PD-(D/E)XK nuclease family protein [bacterium]